LWESQDRGMAAGMYIHDMAYVAAVRAMQRAAA
jgi:hypothetical protein